MKKILITGIEGFVGNYLKNFLILDNKDWELHGVLRSGEKSRNHYTEQDYISHEMDIRDTITVSNLIQEVQPDVVYHLAAQPFVPKAILDPWGTLDTNVKGTLNLLEALRHLDKPVRMVYVSSADVYGVQKPEDIPLDEKTIPNPVNPYASSKISAETYCRQFSLYSQNLEVMIARPFNHIGVGQRLEFVVPNFCSQVIQSLRDKEMKIRVGDLSSTRDFLDVRDVVKAYMYLAEKGESGEIYNICSGKEVSIQSILDRIIQISGSVVSVESDPSRIRPVETPRLYGKNNKLCGLGWEPQYSLDTSLREIYSWINNL